MSENKSIRLKVAGLALAALAPVVLIAAWLRRRGGQAWRRMPSRRRVALPRRPACAILCRRRRSL